VSEEAIRLEELPANHPEIAEASHRLSCENGELYFDWRNPGSIWVAGIESKKQNCGTARSLLEKLYEIGAGGTINLGAIVAHPKAAEGFLRIQQRLAEKHNVKIGHFRLDPTPTVLTHPPRE
jgi:hypothetical protein